MSFTGTFPRRRGPGTEHPDYARAMVLCKEIGCAKAAAALGLPVTTVRNWYYRTCTDRPVIRERKVKARGWCGWCGDSLDDNRGFCDEDCKAAHDNDVKETTHATK